MATVRVLTLGFAATASIAANNGRAIKPPMGWRDWNQYQGAISQEIMEQTMDALVDRSRLVNGVPTSLADLGYTDAGLDDNWQECGSYGPENYTYHDASGNPVVATSRFPDFKAMTTYAHERNLTAGWYGNNCDCHDHCNATACFAGDVNATLAYGFDSIKLDGCGAEENVEQWYDMFNATISQQGGVGMLIENCHNGPNVPHDDWCPFHTYRSSTDIAPMFGSILVNLNSVPSLAASNLSYPGCWAYPDMLEVGVTNTQGRVPTPLNHTEARSHFGAWCVVSAPLVLGLNLTDAPTVDAFWDIITNTEAIAVNQAYAGFSGSSFFSSNDTTTFAPCGWWSDSCAFPSRQYWYKPLPGGATAVLLMNNGVAAADLTFSFADVPSMAGVPHSFAVRDIWAHADLTPATGGFTARAVGPRDSAFLRFTPAAK